MTFLTETVPKHDAKLYTLGICSIEIDGGVPSAIPSNLFRIATYLLMAGNNASASRQRIAAMLWPDADHDQAAVNLRQSLVRIRRFQDEHNFRLIESNFTLVYLDAPNIDWDLHTLTRNLAGRDEASIAILCDLYAGDLLADISASGAEFEEWLSEQRSQLRDTVVDTLTAVLDGYFPVSRQTQTRCARKLLSIDPGNEKALQILMAEAAAHGDFVRLRQIFDRCEHYLKQEFGVASSPQTRALYRELLDRAPRP